MLDVNTLFKNFTKLNVLIIGDVMIDRYWQGKVNRISPEAPVPVVEFQKSDNRLGGAANVALNVKALGATPYLCSVIGADTEGVCFNKIMHDMALSTEGILKSKDRITTVKTRIMAGPLIGGAGITQPRDYIGTHTQQLFNYAAAGASTSLARPRTLTTGILGWSRTTIPSGREISLTWIEWAILRPETSIVMLSMVTLKVDSDAGFISSAIF